MPNTLQAGAAQVDVTPAMPVFLYGYPHVERMSTGVHDPLRSSALYLTDGRCPLLWIANDILFISKAVAREVRRRIARAAPIPAENILVSATHTHSGPALNEFAIALGDPVIPPHDERYVAQFIEGAVRSGLEAWKSARPAQVGLAFADDTGVGTNRHDPAAGPCDHQVPVLMVRSADGKTNIACMLVCSMHPTVLHEDSTLVSADFPGLARAYLQQNVLGADCPVLHHAGPTGDQSPRHVTKANTFAEADRIGRILGAAVAKALPSVAYLDRAAISCRRAEIDLLRRPLPTVPQAEAKLQQVRARLDRLRAENAPRQEVRTAECDWFGAEETVTLAKAAQSGRLEEFYRGCLPAEVQVMSVGPWHWAAWPGEIFVDYALRLKAQRPGSFLITCANGELQCYIVTPQAAAQAWYETNNAIFSAASGQKLLDATLAMIPG